MADVSGPKDETETYDSQHGRTTLAEEQKASGLSEGANQPPPQDVAFRVTTK